jgi:hypothetical protein
LIHSTNILHLASCIGFIQSKSSVIQIIFINGIEHYAIHTHPRFRNPCFSKKKVDDGHEEEEMKGGNGNGLEEELEGKIAE